MHDDPGAAPAADDPRPNLESWRAAAGTYWGLGDGPESGPFTGRVTVADQVDAVELAYEAWSPQRGLQHRERAVLAPASTGLRLVTVIPEIPGHHVFDDDGHRFRLLSPAPFAMAVELLVADDLLTWAWHWAPVGDPPILQSRLNALRVR